MSDSIGDILKGAVGIALMFVPTGTWAWAAHLAGSMLIASALEEEAPKQEEGIEGALANQNSNKAYVPIVYGTRRLGGTRVFAGTHGAKNAYLDMVLVVSEGPIKGFKAVYLEDAFIRFDNFTQSTGAWRSPAVNTFDEGDTPSYWGETYAPGSIVLYEGSYWENTSAGDANADVPGPLSTIWTETTVGVSDDIVVDTNGLDIPWSSNEEGVITFEVDAAYNLSVLTPGYYIKGVLSTATAQITAVDNVLKLIYVQNIRNGSTNNDYFRVREGFTEHEHRTSATVLNTITGLSTGNMKNVTPQYFKDSNATGGPHSYTAASEVVPTTSDKSSNATKEFAGLARFSFHNGATDQAADSLLVAEHPDWSTSHRLRGKAYIYARFKYDKERLTGIPNLTALIDGNLVYDPRDTQTKFTSNPALCIRDYLTNDFYGRGLDATSVDDTAIIASANYADEEIDITDTEWLETGGIAGEIRYVGPRYSVNARLDTGQPIFENIKHLLFAMRGGIVFSNGLYKLIPDKETYSYHTFDEHNIIGGISLSLGNKRNTFNELKISFPNPDQNWESDEAIYFDDANKAAKDNNLSLIKDLSTNSITNKHQALYIGLQELKQSRQQLSISFKTGIEGLLVETGDVLRMRSLRYGWGTVEQSVDGEIQNVYATNAGATIEPHEEYTGAITRNTGNTTDMYKEFRVLGVSLTESFEIQITALEYDPTVYTTYPPSTLDATPNTNMSDTRVSLPPTNLQVTEYLYVSKDTAGFKVGLQLVWETSDSPWDQSYQVSVRAPWDTYIPGQPYTVGSNIFYDGSHYTRINTAISVGDTPINPDIDTDWSLVDPAVALDTLEVVGLTEDRSFALTDVKQGTYHVRVQSINVVGKRSVGADVAYTVVGVLAPPKAVTGLGLIVNNDNAVLTWDKATDLDVLVSGSVQIRHSSVLDLTAYQTPASLEVLWQSASILTEGKSGATTQVFLPLLIGTYLVKFVDASGIFSEAPTAIVNTIAPSASTILVASFSERTDFTTASFDGLTDPADTNLVTSGLEKINHGGIDSLQFDTNNDGYLTSGAFADVPNPSPGNGIYPLHNEFSFSQLTDAELSVDIDVDSYDISNLVSSWTDIDSLASIDDAPYSANLITKISTTQDDPADPLAIWSEYFTFLTGSVKCRGARAAIETSVSSTSAQILIKDITFEFYGKDRVEIVNALEWSQTDFTLGYKDVWFINPFFAGEAALGAGAVTPILNVNLNTAIPGLNFTITNGTQAYQGGPGTPGPDVFAGFRLSVFTSTVFNTSTNLYDPGGTPVEFGYQAVGY